MEIGLRAKSKDTNRWVFLADSRQIGSGRKSCIRKSVFVVVVVVVELLFFNGEIAACPYSDDDGLIQSWELKKRVDDRDWYLVNI